jgi:replicative DNA helicase
MKHDKRYELIGHVCRELKRLAMAAKVPMVVAAQLSRNAENRGKDSKPQLSDLRESGEIEQTADQVLLLHRETDRTLLRVAKYRMGPMFTADLRFVGERCYFDDYGGWR